MWIDKAIMKAYDRIFEGLLEMAKAFEREGKNEEAPYRYSKALELTNRCCMPISKECSVEKYKLNYNPFPTQGQVNGTNILKKDV